MTQHDCQNRPQGEIKALKQKARTIGLEASEAQHKAADPRASVFVSAHAGSGKTYLLVNRVIRLLLSGTPPERILCITYTRAAAAEMRSRIFQRLAKWIHLSDEDLLKSIHDELKQSDFSADSLPLARQLFARALETPGGLRVFTIHGFCERLLQAFPVEAGLPPGFEVLEEAEAAELLGRARTHLLTAPDETSREVRRHLALLGTWQQENGLSALLMELLRHRRLLRKMAQDDDLRNSVYEALAHKVGAAEKPRDAHAWQERWFNRLDAAEIDALRNALAPHVPPDASPRGADRRGLTLLQALSEALAAGDVQAAWNAARRGFLTAEGKMPSRAPLTKKVAAEVPGVHEWLLAAREDFWNAWQGYLARRLLAANVALYETGMAILDLYEKEKLRAGKFDYDDLIIRTLALLDHENLKASWVLYRLDGGIDHILLDEAQDTSPEQWEILERITEDFFAGEGAERSLPRTIFAVGDVKQSIYSFQGAAPEAFHARRRFFERLVREGGEHFEMVPLDVSFRSAPEVLGVVDAVIRQPDFRLGEEGVRPHASARPHVRGLVELWPLEEVAEKDDVDDPAAIWEPPRELLPTMRPQLRLAMRIADTIARWLRDGEALPPDGLDDEENDACEGEKDAAGPDAPRPIRPRDILILVQRRSGFMEPIISALKQRGVPVAGADRLKISEHIAVRDLIALARFLLLPTDDLSLAEVLKSPLLERDDGRPFTDDDLLRLRGEAFDFEAPLQDIDQIHADKPLWRQLQQAAENGAPVGEAVRRLRRWRRMAGHLPPFELFGQVLWRDGGMWRFLRRLSHEAVEPLEAFLDLALQHEQVAQPSLQAFIRWLERDAPEIRREQEGMAHGDDPGEVQVMTVHGAKGLESPVVFLADTVRVPDKGKLGLIEVPLSADNRELRLPLWPLSAAQRPEAVEELVQDALREQEEEYNRLLYVAMTRAADRLIVCGAESGRGGGGDSEGKKKKPDASRIKSWHERLREVLQRDDYALSLPDGRTIWRYPPDTPVCRARRGEDDEAAPRLPAWALAPARPEPGPAEWIAPSRLAAPGLDEVPATGPTPSTLPEEPVLSPLAGQRAGADDPLADPFRRGQLIHTLLQYLPGIPAEQRRQRALRWLKHAEPHLGERQLADIWEEVKGVMEDPRFSALFGPGSRAEVPFATRLRPSANEAGAQGSPILIGGQIDRLVVGEREVLLADFKTARPVPERIEDVPASYVRQMAIYRLAMRYLWPDKAIRCVLLFTAGPKWLEIPARMLDAAASGTELMKSAEDGGVFTD